MVERVNVETFTERRLDKPVILFNVTVPEGSIEVAEAKTLRDALGKSLSSLMSSEVEDVLDLDEREAVLLDEFASRAFPIIAAWPGDLLPPNWLDTNDRVLKAKMLAETAYIISNCMLGERRKRLARIAAIRPEAPVAETEAPAGAEPPRTPPSPPAPGDPPPIKKCPMCAGESPRVLWDGSVCPRCGEDETAPPVERPTPTPDPIPSPGLQPLVPDGAHTTPPPARAPS